MPEIGNVKFMRLVCSPVVAVKFAPAAGAVVSSTDEMLRQLPGRHAEREGSRHAVVVRGHHEIDRRGVGGALLQHEFERRRGRGAAGRGDVRIAPGAEGVTVTPGDVEREGCRHADAGGHAGVEQRQRERAALARLEESVRVAADLGHRRRPERHVRRVRRGPDELQRRVGHDDAGARVAIDARRLDVDRRV